MIFSLIEDRQKFLSDLSSHPRGVLSSMDGEIQRQCDLLFARLPPDYHLRDSRGNQSAIKAILSYYHSLFANQRDLAESEFLYVIPIVLSHYPALSKSVFFSSL